MINIDELREYRGLIKVKSIEELQDLVKFYIKEINTEDRELLEYEVDIESKKIDKYGFTFIYFDKDFYMLNDEEPYTEDVIIACIDYSDIIWETN